MKTSPPAYTPMPEDQLRARVAQALEPVFDDEASQASIDPARHVLDFTDGIRIMLIRIESAKFPRANLSASMSFFGPNAAWLIDLHTDHPYGRPDRYKCAFMIRKRVLSLLQGSGWTLGTQWHYTVTPGNRAPMVLYEMFRTK